MLAAGCTTLNPEFDPFDEAASSGSTSDDETGLPPESETDSDDTAMDTQPGGPQGEETSSGETDTGSQDTGTGAEDTETGAEGTGEEDTDSGPSPCEEPPLELEQWLLPPTAIDECGVGLLALDDWPDESPYVGHAPDDLTTSQFCSHITECTELGSSLTGLDVVFAELPSEIRSAQLIVDATTNSGEPALIEMIDPESLELLGSCLLEPPNNAAIWTHCVIEIDPCLLEGLDTLEFQLEIDHSQNCVTFLDRLTLRLTD